MRRFLALAAVLALAACQPAANTAASNTVADTQLTSPPDSGGAANAAAGSAAGPARQATPPITNPRIYLTEVYARLTREGGWAPPEDMFTPHLQARMADAIRDSNAAGEPGRLDFSPWINGQDAIITQVQISEQPVDQNANRRIVTVRFDNQGQRSTLHFYWERVGDAWLIDNIDSTEGEVQWDLATILKYGWPERTASQATPPQPVG